MSALISYTSPPNKIITDNTPELLDDLKRIGIRFFVGGSHAYRERLSNNYEPNDLDIVVLGAENVAIIRKMLEKKDTPYTMISIKGSFLDRIFRVITNTNDKLFGCSIRTPLWDFIFKQVEEEQAIFWILRYPPVFFAEHVENCTNKKYDDYFMVDWRIAVLMILKDEVRRRYLMRPNAPDRSDKIRNLTEQSKKEMIDFLDVILFKGNKLFAFIFKSLMKKVLKTQAHNADQ